MQGKQRVEMNATAVWAGTLGTLLVAALLVRMTMIRVPFPELAELEPLQGVVAGVERDFQPGRGGHRFLRMRVRGIDAEFLVNAGDRLDDGSDAYAVILKRLRPGVPVRLWARRIPPGLLDDIEDLARYADHTLPGRGGGLASFDAAQARVASFEVVQLELAGARTVDYDDIARAVRREDSMMIGLWVLTAGLVVLMLWAHRRLRRAETGGPD